MISTQITVYIHSPPSQLGFVKFCYFIADFIKFFLKNLFKIAFSLDNKGVQEKFYCEKDFSAQEIYLLEKTYVF